jgi:hypothetical protein
MCGPSHQQEQLAGQATSFASTLQSNYNTQFSNQSDVLSKLNQTMSPILAAGPNQQGYSPQELSTLNSRAISNAGGTYKNAAQAVGGQLAGRGGDSGLTSGVDAQIKAGLASSAAGNASNALNTIQTNNYDVGRDNFYKAAGAQQTLAKLYDPNATGDLANSEGQAAFGEVTKVQDEKNQEQQAIAGGIESIAGIALTGGAGAMGGGGLQGAMTAIASGGKTNNFS